MQMLFNKILAFFFAPSHLCLEKKRKHVFLLFPVRFALTWPPPLVTNEIKLNEIEFPGALFRSLRFSTFCAIRNGNVLIVFHVDKMYSRHEAFSLLFISSVYSKQRGVLSLFFFFINKNWIYSGIKIQFRIISKQ